MTDATPLPGTDPPEPEPPAPPAPPAPPSPAAGPEAPGGGLRPDYRRAIERIRALQEQEHRPGEGLRERKKRLTRQHISDTATWMFCEHGFDAVRVADIAAAVGVSEKTVFNYFPTKESLVFDREDELTTAFEEALGKRDLDTSPTEAVVALIERDARRFADAPPEAAPMLQAFRRLVTETPALRSGLREMTGRLTDALVARLAEHAQVDPRDPEPQITARALLGLWQLYMESLDRHVGEGAIGEQLRDAVMSDVRRAARLLETGLWSFNLVVLGVRTKQQMAEAARAANEARKQVTYALRQASVMWRAARRNEAQTRREHERRQQERREQRRRGR